MTNSKLDVLVLGVLSLLGLAMIGAYALVHPNHAIPAELYGLTGTVIGVLGGRVMPALSTSASLAPVAVVPGQVTIATPDPTSAPGDVA